MNNKAIVRIADTYGYDAQSRQLIEEMAELIVAINKYWRYRKNTKKFEPTTFAEGSLRIRNIMEEIADVTIMLEQIKCLFGISDADIEEIIEYKLNRQLERIDNGLE